MDDKLLLMISSFTEKSEKSAPWAFCFIYKFALLPTSVHLLMATTTFSISPFAQVQKKVHLLHVKYRHPSSKTFDNQPIWVFSEVVRLSDQHYVDFQVSRGTWLTHRPSLKCFAENYSYYGNYPVLVDELLLV